MSATWNGADAQKQFYTDLFYRQSSSTSAVIV